MLRTLALGLLVLACFTVGAAASPIFTTLYSFCSQGGSACTDGARPAYLLLQEGTIPGAPVIFGVAQNGGATQHGVAFELAPNASGTAYSESVLDNFCILSNCVDGAFPGSPLLIDGLGDLYGTTSLGGANPNLMAGEGGTIFELIPGAGGYSERVLYSFCSLADCADGSFPGWLIAPGDGGFYGTTTNGAGTVFRFSVSGGETVLHSFHGTFPNPVGFAAGRLYGSTRGGGANKAGTVFRLSLAGRKTVLHDFGSSPADGVSPVGPLLRGKRGRLYGTTDQGGANRSGTVFTISRTGSEKILYDFCSRTPCRDGAQPVGGLVMDERGDLYGITNAGGAGAFGGTVFELVRSEFGGVVAYTERVLYKFSGCGGNCEPGGLVIDASGNLYGVTAVGGATGGGTVFKLTP
ncbi:MAG TPA: choice-of-anchor tandem repeat GloVer-containing protein [Stellaceae bacterium]|nr:choice-of-anchor tandem repeat GloVer-containing protein [Stellaceae bacterium]